MKYFLDTEFDEAQGRINLISLALVCEDGRAFYAENKDYKPDAQTSKWVIKNVLPKLRYWGEDLETLNANFEADEINSCSVFHQNPKFIGHEVCRLLKDDPSPEFWGYYADYDWVVFMWCYGTMMDKPAKFPYYCRDLKQVLDYHHLDAAWLQKHCPPPAGEHNALVDACWNLQLYRAIEAYVGGILKHELGWVGSAGLNRD